MLARKENNAIMYLIEHRKTTITPEVVKVLSNGINVIAYHWQGAELAEIVENDPVGKNIPYIICWEA